ncbi:MAG: late competence development ComFB family protein [Spirochaetaceae bacterium]|nr:late competence development ComFB family protein [Spirochaetaceae bacterium]
MEIRNLMEEIVEKTVLVICEEEKLKGSSFTTPECLQDVACFVLNRIPQQYVSSSRGVAHAEKALGENPQLLIDVTALVHEGFKRINNVQRPYYAQGEASAQFAGPVFVFPVIKGRLFDSVDFSAARDVEIILKTVDDDTVAMMDARWQNPFFLAPKIEGHYLFFPRPLPAGKEGEEKLFEFKLTVDTKGFEPFVHFFKIGLAAKPSFDPSEAGIPNHRIEDLYLHRI